MRRCLTRRAPSPYRTPVRRRGPALLVMVRSWRGARCRILVSRMVSVGRRRDLLTATKGRRIRETQPGHVNGQLQPLVS
jgi:hypothetical protein